MLCFNVIMFEWVETSSRCGAYASLSETKAQVLVFHFLRRYRLHSAQTGKRS